MVNSSRPLDMFYSKYLTLTGYLYYQDIPDNYRFEVYSRKNNKKFAVSLSDSLEDAYAFAILLKIAIDKN